MNRRGRTVALSTIAVGLVVLVAAGFAAKDRIREEWYLSRLIEEETDETPFAVDQLLKMKSRRSIPILMERWAKREKALSQAQLASFGKEAVPDLIAVLRNSDGEVSFVASILLSRMGRMATPALVKELGTDDLQTYTAVLSTLVRVGAPAIPALSSGLLCTDDRIRKGSAGALEALKARAASKDSKSPAANANSDVPRRRRRSVEEDPGDAR